MANANSEINLCVRHNGEILSFPFQNSDSIAKPAVTIRHDAEVWYNKLVDPSDPTAGQVHLWHNGQEYALSIPVAEEPEEPTEPVETVQNSYENLSRIVTSNDTVAASYWDDESAVPDWTWVDGAEESYYVVLPPEFADVESLTTLTNSVDCFLNTPKVIGLAMNKNMNGENAEQAALREYLNMVVPPSDATVENGVLKVDGETIRYAYEFDFIIQSNDSWAAYAGYHNYDKGYVEYDEDVGGSVFRNVDESVPARVRFDYTIKTSQHTLTVPVKYDPYIYDDVYNNAELAEKYDESTGTHRLWGETEPYYDEDIGLEITDFVYFNPTDNYYTFARLSNGTVVVGLPCHTAFTRTTYLRDSIGGIRNANLQVLGDNNVALTKDTDFFWTQGYYERWGDEPYIDENEPEKGFLTLTASGAAKVTNSLVVKWNSYRLCNYYAANGIDKWRYYNAGTADGLIVASTILTDLPATQSKTGTAFYQTTQAKCFDLPATEEIWIKFDVYFNSSNRWRACNEGAAGLCGVNSSARILINGTSIYTGTPTLPAGQLQTILLHMVSGTTEGRFEVFIGGHMLYSPQTGNVNNGAKFTNVYLWADGEGVFFSNVCIAPDLFNLTKAADTKTSAGL